MEKVIENYYIYWHNLIVRRSFDVEGMQIFSIQLHSMRQMIQTLPHTKNRIVHFYYGFKLTSRTPPEAAEYFPDTTAKMPANDLQWIQSSPPQSSWKIWNRIREAKCPFQSDRFAKRRESTTIDIQTTGCKFHAKVVLQLPIGAKFTSSPWKGQLNPDMQLNYLISVENAFFS